MKSRTIPISILGVFAVLLAIRPSAQNANTLIERPFAAGGTVNLDLSAGGYRIRGQDGDRLRIQWRTRRPEDASRAHVAAEVKGTNATVMTDGPRNGFEVQIDVPRRTDLYLRLSAGDLDIRGIEGNKDVSVWAGDISIEVGDTERYRRVDASVRVGDLGARAFNVSKEGLFRSFQWTGNGAYDLRASLFAGDLKLLK
jgi:hypothetical protein